MSLREERGERTRIKEKGTRCNPGGVPEKGTMESSENLIPELLS